jgi:hypothetical protein
MSNDNVGKCGHAKCAGGNGCFMKGKPMSNYKKDSTPRSKALKKKLVGKEGYKPSKFIDHYE